MSPDPGPSTVALVTGASRGIGRDIAIGLARKGIAVGLVARDGDALERVRAECGPKAAIATADVTSGEQVREAVAAVREQLGPIDLLVNNAGRIESSEVPLWEADPDEWWAIVETDLRGPFLFCHAVLPEMVSRGAGRIVNLTSGVAIADGVIYSGYRAAKTALVRVTAAIIAAAGERGITAFDVSPGHVATDMTLSMEMHRGRTEWTPPEAVTDIVTTIAAGRADSLSGRYLRAGTDDIEALLARADELSRLDARTLRLRPYGDDDPLA
ncbi:SDR family NAD(P)-dependent oxidoreductase [Flindersiella endophytica]